MDTALKRVGGFLILLVDVTLAHDTAEADLNVLARAAEPVIEFKMAKRGIKVVVPHEADRALA